MFILSRYRRNNHYQLFTYVNIYVYGYTLSDIMLNAGIGEPSSKKAHDRRKGATQGIASEENECRGGQQENRSDVHFGSGNAQTEQIVRFQAAAPCYIYTHTIQPWPNSQGKNPLRLLAAPRFDPAIEITFLYRTLCKTNFQQRAGRRSLDRFFAHLLVVAICHTLFSTVLWLWLVDRMVFS